MESNKNKNQLSKQINDQPEREMEEGHLVMPSTEMLGKLENAETGMSLTVSYKTQEQWHDSKGKPIRCYFLGTKEVPNDKGEKVICAGFMSKDEIFLAGQMVLIDAVRRLTKGTAIEITFEGKKPNKSSSGSTNIFTVKLLNII